MTRNFGCGLRTFPLPEIGILQLQAEASEQPIRRAVLQPNIQFVPVVDSRTGRGIDGAPALLIPYADTESGKAILAEVMPEIVPHAAAGRLLTSVVERHCCMSV